MKVKTENNSKQYIIDRINKVYIGFDDNTEVMLDQIEDYDIDLCKNGCSTIEFTNMFNNVEIENHFSKSSHVIYIHIEAIGIMPYYCNEIVKVFYDIPCDMKINRLRTNASLGEVGSMFFELKGFVK